MSGYGDKADFIRSSKAGFRRHLVKPVDIAELEACIEEAARERNGGQTKTA